MTDGYGQAIGAFRKDFAASLLRSTWHLEQPGRPPMTGAERNELVALVRRFTDISFLPYHFDFTAGGTVAGVGDRRPALGDESAPRGATNPPRPPPADR